MIPDNYECEGQMELLEYLKIQDKHGKEIIKELPEENNEIKTKEKRQ